MSRNTRTKPKLSIVVPAYNEVRNLPVLYDRLKGTLDASRTAWEWIVVDDHSDDGSFEVLCDLASRDARVRAIRLARNHGSFTAIACGLRYAAGEAAVVMAADLQDPPEVIPELIDPWKKGAQVVWAARNRRVGETFLTRTLSRTFYWIMRHVVGMKDMSASGADFFLMDRRVLDQFRRFRERSVSIIALITWMGFRQARIMYDKQARVHGRSGWSLDKKLKYALDSITAFTFLPIRLISYTGFVVALAGFCFAGYVLVQSFFDKPVLGYPSLMVAILVIGGLQMIMLGVLGEYLWRTFDEVRGRPRFLVEQVAGQYLPDPSTEHMDDAVHEESPGCPEPDPLVGAPR